MQSLRPIFAALLIGSALASAVSVPAADARRRAYSLHNRFPTGLYGSAFMANGFGHYPQGFTARGDDGLPVYYYSAPTYYRLRINGVHPESQWHRWHELR